MSYPYSATDPGDDPQHYMFSAFGGREFLSDYLFSRVRWLAANAAGADAAPPRTPSALPSPDEPFETDDVLLTLACGEAESRPAPVAWAQVFLRKIEVTRRLKARYHPTIRPATHEVASTDSYAYAAWLLAATMSRTTDDAERLRWLNALLKALDCLQARDTAALSPFARHCASRAVAEEAAAIHELARHLGVTLT